MKKKLLQHCVIAAVAAWAMHAAFAASGAAASGASADAMGLGPATTLASSQSWLR